MAMRKTNSDERDSELIKHNSRELPSLSLSEGGVGEGGGPGEVVSLVEWFTAPVVALTGTGKVELTSAVEDIIMALMCSCTYIV